MAGARKHPWLETLILAVGVVEIAVVATVAVQFGGRVDPSRALLVLGVWALGVVLIGVTVWRGRELGCRHLLATYRNRSGLVRSTMLSVTPRHAPRPAPEVGPGSRSLAERGEGRRGVPPALRLEPFLVLKRQRTRR